MVVLKLSFKKLTNIEGWIFFFYWDINLWGEFIHFRKYILVMSNLDVAEAPSLVSFYYFLVTNFPGFEMSIGFELQLDSFSFLTITTSTW